MFGSRPTVQLLMGLDSVSTHTHTHTHTHTDAHTPPHTHDKKEEETEKICRRKNMRQDWERGTEKEDDSV